MHPVPVILLGFTALGGENNMAAYTNYPQTRERGLYTVRDICHPIPCSGVSHILSAQSPTAFTVPPSSHVTCCEVMSDVIFVWRLTTLGVHWRFKETLQWSEPDLFTMPRGKGDSWQFGHRWGEFCHFRLSLKFGSSCIGSLKRWEVYPHNFKMLSLFWSKLKVLRLPVYLYSDKTTLYSRKITIRKIYVPRMDASFSLLRNFRSFPRNRPFCNPLLSPLRRCLHNFVNLGRASWNEAARARKHGACARVSAPTLVSKICTRSQTAIPHAFSS